MSLILGAGCSHTQLPKTSRSTPAPIHQSISQLEQKKALQCWLIKGKVGVIPYDTDLKGGTANLIWEQKYDQYWVQLSGPFGSGKLQLEGTIGGTVKLTDSEGAFFEGPNADTLLENIVGWIIPIENFRWWIRGLPAPIDTDNSLLTLDKNGNLSSIQQGEWLVEFRTNQTVNDIMVPKRLHTTHRRVKIKASLNSWRQQACYNRTT